MKKIEQYGMTYVALTIREARRVQQLLELFGDYSEEPTEEMLRAKDIADNMDMKILEAASM